MTREEITTRIAEITHVLTGTPGVSFGSCEEAHEEEDNLRHDVLKAIAAGVDDPQDLARLVLTTSDIPDFDRWYE